MPTLQELQESRNKIATDIRSLADKFNENNHQWQGEDEQQWTRLNAEYDDIAKQVKSAADVAERLKDISDAESRSINDRIPGTEDTRLRKPIAEGGEAITEEHRALAMAAWCRSQMGMGLTEQQEQNCKRTGFNPNQKELRMKFPSTSRYRDLQRVYRSTHPNLVQDAIRESRAMSAYTFATGGVLAPDAMLRNLEMNMLAFGGVRQVADLLVTGSGERMSWPTADDTSNQGEQIGENTSVGASVEPTFGAVYWDAYKFSSKPILVPHELMEDSFMDLPGYLGEIMGERLGRITATKMTTGDGASTCKGIVTAATLGKTAASATAITADEIIDLEHSVDPAYRNGASYMMHDSVLLYIRKLKDAEGRYLWQNGLAGGAPDRLNNHPLTISMEMASSVATGNKTILYGQLSKYKIRRVNEVRMYRLEERYRDTDQDGFIAFIREDGNLLDAGTAPVKFLQQA